jgi:general secretion pathway protein I
MRTKQTAGTVYARRGARMTNRTVRGFTLIEVLIALAIVAIALGAVLRAIGSLAADTDSARQHLLALWSADNALSELRISSAWPPPGQTTFACPQGAYRFVCRQVVTALGSPLVRQVTVSVYPSAANRIVLAEVVTVMQNEAHY